MASLVNVSLGSSEPTDQEVSEALLGPWKITCRVHGPQKVVLRNLSIKRGDEPCETFRANHTHWASNPEFEKLLQNIRGWLDRGG